MSAKTGIELHTGSKGLPELSYSSWKALSIASQRAERNQSEYFDSMDVVAGLMFVDPTERILTQLTEGKLIRSLAVENFIPEPDLNLRTPMSNRVWRALVLGGFRRLSKTGYADPLDPEDILLGLYCINVPYFYLKDHGASVEKVAAEVKKIIRI